MPKDRRKPPAPPTGKPGLTEEDAALWSRVAKTARPLEKGRDRVTGPAPPEGREAAKPGPANDRPPPEARPRKPTPAKPAAPKTPPPVAAIDRRDKRQLGAGRRSVDARLDLHGLRQEEAYRALRAFLIRAQARGHRHVLVITGKGGARADDADRPFYEERDRGVLKRLVPQWLAEAELRRMVVSYGEAHTRHGGEGALYVRLRRPAKSD
ncbi:MAG: Smr/MutS family protein [Hyphomicrobiales bacterium]|nr:Smr/MutS family protein [Hyphomicrobiales bacterium]